MNGIFTERFHFFFLSFFLSFFVVVVVVVARIDFIFTSLSFTRLRSSAIFKLLHFGLLCAKSMLCLSTLMQNSADCFASAVVANL